MAIENHEISLSDKAGAVFEVAIEIRPARFDDLHSYAEFGREAQSWLKSRGLEQYVPAAHEVYAAAAPWPS